jgi:hypothetical protein
LIIDADLSVSAKLIRNNDSLKVSLTGITKTDNSSISSGQSCEFVFTFANGNVLKINADIQTNGKCELNINPDKTTISLNDLILSSLKSHAASVTGGNLSFFNDYSGTLKIQATLKDSSDNIYVSNTEDVQILQSTESTAKSNQILLRTGGENILYISLLAISIIMFILFSSRKRRPNKKADLT